MVAAKWSQPNGIAGIAAEAPGKSDDGTRRETARGTRGSRRDALHKPALPGLPSRPEAAHLSPDRVTGIDSRLRPQALLPSRSPSAIGGLASKVIPKA